MNEKNQTLTPRKAYTLKEVASTLGIHYSSVWRLVARGKLRTIGGMKRNRLIPESELNRFLQSFDD
jgi:excisionase family DNA binding protein